MLSPVEKLAAIEEIKALKSRYLRAVDGHDWPGYRSLLTDDCVFCPQNTPEVIAKFVWKGTIPQGWWIHPRIEGADTIVGFIKKSHVGITSLHRSYMPDIEIISADEARGTWGIEDIVRWSAGRFANGFGHYRDQYVRQNGAWRFKTISVIRTSMEVRTDHREAVRLNLSASHDPALPLTDRLLAINEITALKSRYFRSLDSHDWATYRSLLADDCVFCPNNTPDSEEWPGTIPKEMWRVPRVDGADKMVAWIKEAFVDTTSIHRGFMPEIAIVSPDEAHCIWGLEDTVHRPGMALHGFGHCYDRYVRQNGTWRIKSIDLIRTSVEIRNLHREAVKL